MQTMKQFNQILLILALIAGSSLTFISCGEDDNGSNAIVLDGLWEVTEIISEEEDPVADNEDGDGDGTTSEDDGTADGDADAGSPPSKTEGESQEAVVEDLGYIRFGLNTYTYFTVEGETMTTHSSGTYILSGKTLTLTEDENTAQPVIAMVELKGNQLTMEIVFEEGPQIWHAQKLAEDPFEDKDGEETEFIDFESEVHQPDSVPGSLWNPDLMALNQSITGTLEYVESYKAEQFYYLKVDSTRTYQLRVELDNPEYDLPAEFMEYVQIWLSNQPYEKNYKAEGDRIQSGETQATFNNITSPTGYLYIRLFSYQDQIKYALTLSEQQASE